MRALNLFNGYHATGFSVSFFHILSAWVVLLADFLCASRL